MVHIIPKPVVRGEQVRILSFKTVPGMINGGQGIFIVVLRIIKQLDAVLVDEVIKLFLQISDNDGNIHDAGLMELADLPLDHPLPENLQQPLGRFKGQRNKAGAEARRQDHRAVHPVFLEQLHALL